jgi:hypothetical protein
LPGKRGSRFGGGRIEYQDAVFDHIGERPLERAAQSGAAPPLRRHFNSRQKLENGDRRLQIDGAG